jgi:hypothetical protein
MKVIVKQNQLSKFLTKFLSEDGKEYNPTMIVKFLKYLHIIGKDEEIGLYILNQIKKENLTNYDINHDFLNTEITFSIKSFPFKLLSDKIIFNRGARDMEFTLTSPILGNDVELDVSYRVLKKIHSQLFNYR